MSRALILQHGDWGPPAVLGDWAHDRGIAFDVYRVDHGGPWPALDDRPFVASLGSKHSPADTHIREVREEVDYVATAIRAGVAVLGLCYGGQVLAVALGGRVEPAPEPELGWHAVDTDAPDRIAPGPWLQWHYHRFTVPPGARELARSPRAAQAFDHGVHLGVQFHPESTIEIVQGWARLDGERLGGLGIADGEALAGDGAHFAEAAHDAAYNLFDAFWERARSQAVASAGTRARVPADETTREESSVSTTSPIEAVRGGRPGADGGPPITSIRLLYPDLHGVARGKDVPFSEFDHVAETGLCFCSAVMGTDLRHTPVVGGEQGYPDLIARPDLDTMLTLPWEPGVACCLANLAPVEGGPAICDPRGALRRAIETVRALGLDPIVGPELEFFLLVRDPAAPNGVRRQIDQLSMVYTVGPQADPGGLVRRMSEQLSQLGLDVFAVNHEFMNSQYEINLRHSDALSAADRAFRLKTAVKDIAAQNDLVATFMGKPFNDQGGSGTHLHVSLNRDGANAFDERKGANGVSAELRAFTAGVLAHAGALMAFLNPTVNAYRRIQPDSLAPTHANWGLDNRASFIRIPPERGGATRVEIRVGDGAANPYLAIAAVLLAGAQGVRDELTPPAPVTGDAYRAQPDMIGEPLPTSLDAALDALDGDSLLREGLGEEIVSTFTAMKRFEIERHRAWVSDWEIAEYLHHL